MRCRPREPSTDRPELLRCPRLLILLPTAAVRCGNRAGASGAGASRCWAAGSCCHRRSRAAWRWPCSTSDAAGRVGAFRLPAQAAAAGLLRRGRADRRVRRGAPQARRRSRDIPKVMKDAVLAAEDARFYEHGGVDYKGMRARRAGQPEARQEPGRLHHHDAGGAQRLPELGEDAHRASSTRCCWPSSSSTSSRKDQILEIYLNQIYLGHRAYGFAAAAQTYFGKPLQDITLAEAAMLAGLPKAPGANNPVSNPSRARARQLYVIDRMQETGFITRRAGRAGAKAETLHLRDAGDTDRLHAEYVAETVRQLMYAQYGDEHLHARAQGLHHAGRGRPGGGLQGRCARASWTTSGARSIAAPRSSSTCRPTPKEARRRDRRRAGRRTPTTATCWSAVVLEASAEGSPCGARQRRRRCEITGEGLQPGAVRACPTRRRRNIRIRRGAVIRVAKTPKDTWEITQLPEVEGAFVALDPRDGADPGAGRRLRLRQEQVQPRRRRPGASRARASSPSSIRRRSRRASRRPP